MKKLMLLGIFFLFGVGAFAQDLPRTEVYLGYSFTGSIPPSPCPHFRPTAAWVKSLSI